MNIEVIKILRLILNSGYFSKLFLSYCNVITHGQSSDFCDLKFSKGNCLNSLGFLFFYFLFFLERVNKNIET